MRLSGFRCTGGRPTTTQALGFEVHWVYPYYPGIRGLGAPAVRTDLWNAWEEVVDALSPTEEGGRHPGWPKNVLLIVISDPHAAQLLGSARQAQLVICQASHFGHYKTAASKFQAKVAHDTVVSRQQTTLRRSLPRPSPPHAHLHACTWHIGTPSHIFSDENGNRYPPPQTRLIYPPAPLPRPTFSTMHVINTPPPPCPDPPSR